MTCIFSPLHNPELGRVTEGLVSGRENSQKERELGLGKEECKCEERREGEKKKRRKKKRVRR